MAITVFQSPSRTSAIGSKLIIAATSTLSGNDGFKYVVRITAQTTPDAQMTEFIVPGNASNTMVFDIAPVVKSYVRNLPMFFASEPKPIHALNQTFIIEGFGFYDQWQSQFQYAGCTQYGITILEGYNVGGVFTIDESSETIVYPSDQIGYGVFDIFNYNDFSIKDGFMPSLIDQIGHVNGNQSRIMSDRDSSTSTWDMAESFGLNDNAIFIPTYESDWGVWSIHAFDNINSSSQAHKIRLGILPNSGPPVQQVIDLPIGTYLQIGLFPANLNNNTDPIVLKPSDYPNWKAIYFQVLDETDQIVSKSYVMYNAERDGNCERFDKIRIGWVGRRGGWEYHNFTMKSEESYVTDKVVAQRVVGNYGAVDYNEGVNFGFNKFDESEVVVDLKIQKFITANSDWLTEGEFEFLKGLFLSKQVHWVQDDGSHIPVILEANGYEVKRQFTQGKLYNQQIKFKIAQEQFN